MPRICFTAVIINFSGQRIEKLTNPTPTQRRAFELLGAPVPITLQ